MNVLHMSPVRRPVLATLIAMSVAMPMALGAQRPSVGTIPHQSPGRWTLVRTSKWVLLGGAVGLGAYALHHSMIAAEAYRELRQVCEGDADRCQVSGGHYSDAGAEALFARSVDADRHAQIGIFGGQVALLGSVGLFIYDLRNGHGPRDIPFPSKSSVGVGLRVPF